MRVTHELRVPLALACLLAAASAADAGRALLQFNPAFRQFVQITVSLRGSCNAVLTASPGLLSDVRFGAVDDVRTQLMANPNGVSNMQATLASVRARAPNCTAVMVSGMPDCTPAPAGSTGRCAACAAASRSVQRTCCTYKSGHAGPRACSDAPPPPGG